MENNKICKIINGEFSWILIVDGFEISFQGSESAAYFSVHYNNLGYTVLTEYPVSNQNLIK